MSRITRLQKLVIIGGGGHARVLIEAARAQGGWDIQGFIDPSPCEGTVKLLGVPHLGDDSVLNFLTDERIILGVGVIGVSTHREEIVARVAAPDKWANVIHPGSIISTSARLAPGVAVLAGAVVCSGAQVEDHAIINLGALINHDARVGKFVHVAPQAVLGGAAIVEDGAYIGMGALVRNHVTVETKTLVGMGAVVTKRFPSGSTLVGVPAKPMKRPAQAKTPGHEAS